MNFRLVSLAATLGLFNSVDASFSDVIPFVQPMYNIMQQFGSMIGLELPPIESLAPLGQFPRTPQEAQELTQRVMALFNPASLSGNAANNDSASRPVTAASTNNMFDVFAPQNFLNAMLRSAAETGASLEAERAASGDARRAPPPSERLYLLNALNEQYKNRAALTPENSVVHAMVEALRLDPQSQRRLRGESETA